MELFIEGESRGHWYLRHSKYLLRREIPRTVKMNVKRLKFSGFDVPVVQGIPVPVLHFGIRSSLEYHEDFCDLMCYCPVTDRYFESPVNYCPQCGLNMTKVRMRKGEAS